MSDLLRKTQQQNADVSDKKIKAPKGGAKSISKGWVKMGSIQINISDPLVGSAETLFEVLDDFKAKLSRIKESLKSLDDITNLSVPEGASYSLHLKEGVVERLIVDAQEAKPQKFSFSASFNVT